ncbi:thermonuclease family protein [Mycoplasma elephantis]|uniref:thermonuclease family protein n=1 Tax=Mycoplasma elephantis TaxID=114882 RepID=UPI000480A9F5|nr:thermonuclease family protein [Mycoplasma elephantis]
MFLSDLILEKRVKLLVIKKDKYLRKVVQISMNSVDISKKMISCGMAKVAYISKNKKDFFYYDDEKFIDDLYSLQQEAIIQNLNIWSSNLKLIYPD